MTKSVSIVIPTYKEKENITPLVEKIHNALSKQDYEILLIDDNSNDGSEELVKELSSDYPVKIIVRKDKRGLASAVVDGIALAEGENVIVMDADLQHPPEKLPEIIEALKNNEFVMASRYIKGGSAGDWTPFRKFVSFVANLLALPIAYKIKDRMSGFFGFRRANVDTASLSPLGWKIGLEIFVRNKFNSVAEVPYIFAQRSHGTSKLSRRIIFQYIQQLIPLYLYKFQIIKFVIVGGIGYLVNIGLYSLLILLPALRSFQMNELGKNYYLLPFVLSSLVAIVSNYTLNRIWTFRGWSEKSAGFFRYLTMGLITLVFDMAFLYFLVEYVKLAPIPAASLAILIVFIIRFSIARSWVWKKTSPSE